MPASAGAIRPRRRSHRLPAVVGLGVIFFSGCSSLHESTRDAGFLSRHRDATYCEVKAVRQTAQKTCGLACLSCVLDYWERPVPEPELRRRHPLAGEGAGYSLKHLQAIATQEGLAAFAVDMSAGGRSPARELSTHLAKGRPVIVALHCPQGRYFGRPLPLIETLDRRTLRLPGAEPAFKHHYVVVLGETADTYLVMDPAYGIGEVQKQPLLDWWRAEKYAALICTRVPDSAATVQNVLATQQPQSERIFH